MQHYNYQDTFRALYDKAYLLYEQGNRNKESYFEPSELVLISQSGWRAQDFFDYAEDAVLDNAPSYEIAQAIEQVRREYYLHIQESSPSPNRISTADLPAKSDVIDGITWLPRILPKARGKLLGELPDEIMYCCGGDRNFLTTHDIHPAEFLRVIWANLNDDQGIVEFVKQRSPESDQTTGPGPAYL